MQPQDQQRPKVPQSVRLASSAAPRSIAPVDYSAAKGGPLAAYRFDGEPELLAEKFVST